MDNQCTNDAEYIDRANNFFDFDDYNNCERIVKAVDEYLAEKED